MASDFDIKNENSDNRNSSQKQSHDKGSDEIVVRNNGQNDILSDNDNSQSMSNISSISASFKKSEVEESSLNQNHSFDLHK